jgi:hypothetical protein
MTSDEVYKLIEANGLTFHGDIEHFAALIKQRTWVGLTDEEVLDMARTFGAQPWPPRSCVALGQMIEAKLKELNT